MEPFLPHFPFAFLSLLFLCSNFPVTALTAPLLSGPRRYCPWPSLPSLQPSTVVSPSPLSVISLPTHHRVSIALSSTTTTRPSLFVCVISLCLTHSLCVSGHRALAPLCQALPLRGLVVATQRLAPLAVFVISLFVFLCVCGVLCVCVLISVCGFWCVLG